MKQHNSIQQSQNLGHSLVFGKGYYFNYYLVPAIG